jgi:16S rRNA (cytidine1402-2'-O)-methyltransferase
MLSSPVTGCLYVVATPIGNLQDCSSRMLDILRTVNRIAAEDTRHSRRLLDYFGIQTPLQSLH